MLTFNLSSGSLSAKHQAGAYRALDIVQRGACSAQRKSSRKCQLGTSAHVHSCTSNGFGSPHQQSLPPQVLSPRGAHKKLLLPKKELFVPNATIATRSGKLAEPDAFCELTQGGLWLPKRSAWPIVEEEEEEEEAKMQHHAQKLAARYGANPEDVLQSLMAFRFPKSSKVCKVTKHGGDDRKLRGSSAYSSMQHLERCAQHQPSNESKQQGRKHNVATQVTVKKPSPTFAIGVAQDQGPCPYWEDRAFVQRALQPLDAEGKPIKDGVRRMLLGVFDGHGLSRRADGVHEAAEVAGPALAHCLARHSCHSIVGDGSEEAMAEGLQHAFLRTDRHLLKLADKRYQQWAASGASQRSQFPDPEGTTAVTLLAVGSKLHVAHVGDSRAVMCRSGWAMPLTRDHTPEVPEEADRVRAAGGFISHSRGVPRVRAAGVTCSIAMTRSLGDSYMKGHGAGKGKPCVLSGRPDVRHVELMEGSDQFVILATDGIWNLMSNEEAVDVVSEALSQRAEHSKQTDTTGSTSPTASSAQQAHADAAAAAQAGADALLRRARQIEKKTASGKMVKGLQDNALAMVVLIGWGNNK